MTTKTSSIFVWTVVLVRLAYTRLLSSTIKSMISLLAMVTMTTALLPLLKNFIFDGVVCIGLSICSFDSAAAQPFLRSTSYSFECHLIFIVFLKAYTFVAASENMSSSDHADITLGDECKRIVCQLSRRYTERISTCLHPDLRCLQRLKLFDVSSN